MLLPLVVASQLALAAAPPGDAPRARVPAGARLLAQAGSAAPGRAKTREEVALEQDIETLTRQINQSSGAGLVAAAWAMGFAGGAGVVVFGSAGLTFLVVSGLSVLVGSRSGAEGMMVLAITSLGLGALSALVLIAAIVVAIVVLVSRPPPRKQLIEDRIQLQKELDAMRVAPPAFIHAPGAMPLQLVTVAAF